MTPADLHARFKRVQAMADADEAFLREHGSIARAHGRLITLTMDAGSEAEAADVALAINASIALGEWNSAALLGDRETAEVIQFPAKTKEF